MGPVFELFEEICSELSVTPEQVLPETSFDVQLIESLKEHLEEPSEAAAFTLAIDSISHHFAQRNAVVPYTFTPNTREFKVTDKDFVDFIAFAKATRSLPGDDAKSFEENTLQRLRKRLTGDLRRVGSPRSKLKTRVELIAYLEALGFGKDCLRAYDKDGGLDILWLPPLGAIPIRPVVSVQCKNGFVDEGEANKSNGRAQKTLSKHRHQKREQMRLVVFNDYIDDDVAEQLCGCSFHPLGLTDLASVGTSGVDEIL